MEESLAEYFIVVCKSPFAVSATDILRLFRLSFMLAILVVSADLILESGAVELLLVDVANDF